MSRLIAKHSIMIDDELRTSPLLRAIRRSVKKGSVAVDVGTGLGILAIEAAKAGARKVYAIDFDGRAIAEARRSAAKAGVADAIKFMCGLSYDIELPERVDLIISETVGSFAFDENIIATIADAKARFLKRGGSIIPQKLELWGAPICKIPKLDMPAEIAITKPENLLSKPKLMTSIDFKCRLTGTIRMKAEFRCDRAGAIKAFAVWPRIAWGGRDMTDASPLKEKTHWKQGILPVEEKRVAKGDKVAIEIIFQPHPDDPRTMTERLWRLR